MKGHPILYSTAERRWIKAHSQDCRRQAHAWFSTRFKRVDVSLSNFNAFCKRMGWMTGRTGCFKHGAPPHNKGKPCPDGVGGRHPNARRTQFKGGARSGFAVKLYKPIGTERVTKDGYIERKVNDDKPEHKRWRPVQVIRWEEINGPIPAGLILKCLDGNRHNTEPSNWEAIPREVSARLQRGRWGTNIDYETAPAELKPAIMALAKLKHAACGHGAKQAPADKTSEE